MGQQANDLAFTLFPTLSTSPLPPGVAPAQPAPCCHAARSPPRGVERGVLAGGSGVGEELPMECGGSSEPPL